MCKYYPHFSNNTYHVVVGFILFALLPFLAQGSGGAIGGSFPGTSPSITSTYGSTEADGIRKAVCNVIGALQGDVVRAIAAFGIIFLGFSLFLGKISWGVGLALAIGLGAVLGASQIVGVISGTNMSC